MMTYRTGDFVRIREPETSKIDRIRNKHVNIFRIDKIEEDFILLEDYRNALSTADIEPIPIDGTSDFQIYYDPIVVASIVVPREAAPIYRTNYSYYFDRFQSCSFEGKNVQQLVQEKGLKFVHEVQHFLIDEFKDWGLKANLY